ncbi:MAG TPA: hypothetical protein DD670_09395 [Planctomycetaceae bacterium]|nr:hypothetical protein [Planctomycetaceae bacterium]
MRESQPRPEHGLNGLKKYLVGVAVAMTTALLGQSMALVWWAATITTRVEYVEKAVDGLDGRVHAIETTRSPRPS